MKRSSSLWLFSSSFPSSVVHLLWAMPVAYHCYRYYVCWFQKLNHRSCLAATCVSSIFPRCLKYGERSRIALSTAYHSNLQPGINCCSKSSQTFPWNFFNNTKQNLEIFSAWIVWPLRSLLHKHRFCQINIVYNNVLVVFEKKKSFAWQTFGHQTLQFDDRLRIRKQIFFIQCPTWFFFFALFVSTKICHCDLISAHWIHFRILRSTALNFEYSFILILSKRLNVFVRLYFLFLLKTLV